MYHTERKPQSMTDLMITSNIKSSDIKHFVREQLGCACPDEVFSTIRVTRKPDSFEGMPIDCLIEIGNRLLVAVSMQALQKLNSNLEKIFLTGRAYRDSHGFNRFRLVVATADKETQISIQSAFDSLTLTDEKIHLHVIYPAVLPENICS